MDRKTQLIDKIKPPWTDEQIAALNRFQQSDYVHPFTCGTEPHHDGNRGFVAVRDGWYCPGCTYQQTWAHRFMLNQPPDHVDFTPCPARPGGSV